MTWEPPPVQADRVEDAYDDLAPVYDDLYADAESAAEDRWLRRRLLDAIGDVGTPEHRRSDLAVLDVGCGTGWLLDTLGDELRAARFTGLDVSEGMLAQARSKHGEIRGRRQWTHGSMVAPWPGVFGGYDLVTSTWCSASYLWPEMFAARAAAVLRHGGRVLAMPHAQGNELRPAHLPIEAYTPNFAADEYYQPWSSYRAERAFKAAGFTDVRVTGLRHPTNVPPPWTNDLGHDLWLRWETRSGGAGQRHPDDMTFLVIEATLTRTSKEHDA